MDLFTADETLEPRPISPQLSAESLEAASSPCFSFGEAVPHIPIRPKPAKKGSRQSQSSVPPQLAHVAAELAQIDQTDDAPVMAQLRVKDLHNMTEQIREIEKTALELARDEGRDYFRLRSLLRNLTGLPPDEAIRAEATAPVLESSILDHIEPHSKIESESEVAIKGEQRRAVIIELRKQQAAVERLTAMQRTGITSNTAVRSSRLGGNGAGNGRIGPGHIEHVKGGGGSEVGSRTKTSNVGSSSSGSWRKSGVSKVSIKDGTARVNRQKIETANPRACCRGDSQRGHAIDEPNRSVLAEELTLREPTGAYDAGSDTNRSRVGAYDRLSVGYRGMGASGVNTGAAAGIGSGSNLCTDGGMCTGGGMCASGGMCAGGGICAGGGMGRGGGMGGGGKMGAGGSMVAGGSMGPGVGMGAGSSLSAPVHGGNMHMPTNGYMSAGPMTSMHHPEITSYQPRFSGNYVCTGLCSVACPPYASQPQMHQQLYLSNGMGHSGEYMPQHPEYHRPGGHMQLEYPHSYLVGHIMSQPSPQYMPTHMQAYQPVHPAYAPAASTGGLSVRTVGQCTSSRPANVAFTMTAGPFSCSSRGPPSPRHYR